MSCKDIKSLGMDQLYDCPYLDTIEERMELMRHKGGVTRLKTIKCGRILESEIYPTWSNEPAVVSECKSSRTAAQERQYYEKKQKKHMERLLNTNFVDGDIWAKLGYRESNLPTSMEDADALMIKYIRKLARYCKKHNLPKLKYMFITEERSGDGEVVRVHHHLVINFKDRDLLETMWAYEDRANTKRIDTKTNGLCGMGNYILKTIKGKKSYHCSLGLKKPTIYTADSKITTRVALQMAYNAAFCESKLAKLYPGYALIEVQVLRSSIVEGVYIRAKFRQLGMQSTALINESMPLKLTKEQVKRIRNKLNKILTLKVEIESLERELVKSKTAHIQVVKKAINKAIKARQKLLAYFEHEIKRLPASDRAIMRDRYVNGMELTELAHIHHYADKSAAYRKISKIIANFKV